MIHVLIRRGQHHEDRDTQGECHVTMEGERKVL